VVKTAIMLPFRCH